LDNLIKKKLAWIQVANKNKLPKDIRIMIGKMIKENYYGFCMNRRDYNQYQNLTSTHGPIYKKVPTKYKKVPTKCDPCKLIIYWYLILLTLFVMVARFR